MAGNKVIETLKFYKPKFIIQWNHWGRTMAMAGSQCEYNRQNANVLQNFLLM